MVPERAARAAAGHRSRPAHARAARARRRASACPARVALALNLLTEEGLPHFHRLLAAYLGGDTFWSKWTNLWTAEEDRHGAVLHDYTRDSRILDNPVLERMQFEYLQAGFEPAWDKDPYRVFVYTTLQERATQVSHANTGKLAGEYEPTIGTVLSNVAKEEARHYTFYRTIFKEVLERDPNTALASAAEIMPSIDMPGVNMPHFREMADVIRRAGIYGPRDYLKIVEEQIRFWAIDDARRPRRDRASRRRRRSSASRSGSSASPTRWRRAAARRPSPSPLRSRRNSTWRELREGHRALREGRPVSKGCDCLTWPQSLLAGVP